MSTRYVLPSQGGFIHLARTKSGRMFRKQLLVDGEFVHPNPSARASGRKLVVNRAMREAIKRNFDSGVVDIVQIPLAGDKNEHTEAPDRNVGEIIGVELTEHGLDAIFDIRSEQAAADTGKTLLGASALIDPEHLDVKTGANVGPTLLHACITNRPYITGLEGFSELVAATADSSGDETVALAAAQTEPENEAMTLEELDALLKSEHGIDVAALLESAKAEGAASVTPAESTDNALVAALTAALGGANIELSAGSDEPDLPALVASVTKIATENVALSSRIETLEGDRVASEVESLIAAGRIMPAQKDAMIALCRTDRALFDQIVPAEPLIDLSGGELGTDTTQPVFADGENQADYIARMEREYLAPAKS